MVNKRKILLTAAVAGLFAAGAVVQQAAPVFADDTNTTPGQAGCNGQNGCKGEEAAAPTTGEGAAAAGTETKAETPKAKPAKKSHNKKKKGKKADHS